ncbi:hypothetical protein PE36_17882, partial [Moritella sp. PE36]
GYRQGASNKLEVLFIYATTDKYVNKFV